MTRVTAAALALVAAAAIAVAVAVALIAGRSSSHEAAPQSTRATRASIRVADSKLGRIVVDGRGRTLYLYIKDSGTHSVCAGPCARVWPPATVDGTPTAGPGIAAAKLTTTQRADHRRQLVYNGHPLYTLSSDARPGQIGGEGFLGVWYVVSAAGNRIGKLRPSSSVY
jgi:predicted lipoprotein with Yx(FWY)xxD motif